MRKAFSALLGAAAAFAPLLAQAADVCSRVSGKGLMDGVCVECYAEGRCQIADFFIVGNTITKLILGLSGSVMLLMVVYGGFLWLASSGNSGMIEKGKKVLISSIIGLIIVFGAYSATQFLVAAMVCRAGESCTAVDEIFARPFQQVKPPGGDKPAAKKQEPSSSASSEEAAATGTCRCDADFYDQPGATVMKESTCTFIAQKGLSCEWQSGQVCFCKGVVSSLREESQCSWPNALEALGIPNLQGVNMDGGCDWEENGE